MKRQSKRREPRVTLFVDRNLGGKKIIARLRSVHVRCVAHDDCLAPTTPDPEWIAYACKRRWVILSADRAMRRVYLEIAAINRWKAAVFCPAFKQDRTADAIADAVIAAQRKMRRVLQREARPFIATITIKGDVVVRMNRAQIGDYLRRAAPG